MDDIKLLAIDKKHSLTFSDFKTLKQVYGQNKRFELVVVGNLMSLPKIIIFYNVVQFC